MSRPCAPFARRNRRNRAAAAWHRLEDRRAFDQIEWKKHLQWLDGRTRRHGTLQHISIHIRAREGRNIEIAACIARAGEDIAHDRVEPVAGRATLKNAELLDIKRKTADAQQQKPRAIECEPAEIAQRRAAADGYWRQRHRKTAAIQHHFGQAIEVFGRAALHHHQAVAVIERERRGTGAEAPGKILPRARDRHRGCAGFERDEIKIGCRRETQRPFAAAGCDQIGMAAIAGAGRKAARNRIGRSNSKRVIPPCKRAGVDRGE